MTAHGALVPELQMSVPISLLFGNSPPNFSWKLFPSVNQATMTASASGSGATATVSSGGETITAVGTDGETTTVTSEAVSAEDTESHEEADSDEKHPLEDEEGDHDHKGEEHEPPLLDEETGLNLVVIGAAASGGVIGLVALVLLCMWCSRARDARRMPDVVVQGTVPDQYVPQEGYRERRDSIPWGHPGAQR